MIAPVQIGNRLVGQGQPCFVIAEAGVNHNGRLETAIALIEEAKKAGADAVKFQTFTPENVITAGAPKTPYQLQTTEKNESQLEMLRKLQLTHEDFCVLKKHADKVGIMFLSTPADASDTDLLVELGVATIKLPSMDIVNYPFLNYVAKKALPIILSTGMATLGEVEQGLETVWAQGNRNIVLLHCVTNYPIKNEEANLRNIETLRQAFQIPIGYSDHTPNTAVAVAAVALGAVLIEKHFTLDCSMKGPDHAASLEPAGFAAMVEDIRAAEEAMGSPVKRPVAIEMENRKAMRRSLVAVQDIPKGTAITADMLAMKRPGTGLGAEYLDIVVGRKARQLISKDMLIKWEMV